MKFLLDVCVSSRSLLAFLAASGQDVVSAVTIDPRASDERILAVALQENRIIVTEDKDFGELVFVRRLPHGPIVRLVEMNVDEQIRAMSELLEWPSANLAGSVLITITRSRIRIRRY